MSELSGYTTPQNLLLTAKNTPQKFEIKTQVNIPKISTKFDSSKTPLDPTLENDQNISENLETVRTTTHSLRKVNLFTQKKPNGKDFLLFKNFQKETDSRHKFDYTSRKPPLSTKGENYTNPLRKSDQKSESFLGSCKRRSNNLGNVSNVTYKFNDKIYQADNFALKRSFLERQGS
jgi:hypothetical protein